MRADRLDDDLYLRPLDDPALSDEEKESHRLELEWKYGLLAAQRADEAIEIYGRARVDAQRIKTVVHRIDMQRSHTLDKVVEAERALQDAKLQAARLATIRGEEAKALNLARKACSQAKTRAKESFAEYSSKAVQQGLDEALSVSYRRDRSSPSYLEFTTGFLDSKQN